MPIHISGRARPWAGAVAGLLLVLVAGQFVSQPSPQNSASYVPRAAGGVQTSAVAAPDTVPKAGVITGQDLKHDVSPALSRVVPNPPKPTSRSLPDRNDLDRLSGGMSPSVMDPVVQSSFGAVGATTMPAPGRNFDGIYNYWGYYPPDTNGDVGPNHYVQIVNAGFQIYSKNGNSLYGPADTNTLWRGFGGTCETSNDGDPIALYDPIADRWMITQFAVPGGAAGFHQCIAVSASADPTGAYYRYDFLISQTLFNDYPHFGVWPDGYYAAMDMFRNNTYAGAEPLVFDRASMLAGRPATFQAFPPDSNNHSMLPADLDGTLLPPAGEPDIYATIDVRGQAQMRFFNFHVDWTNPANSTFMPAASIAVAPFNTPCLKKNCISQPGTTQLLDALADRLMFRLAYRNFGDHQALVTNHTVDTLSGGSVNTGVRWYEFRSTAGGPMAPTLYQQGTYAPDSDNRWMGSVAMDRRGNIAAGYSVSSNSTYPSIRYTGRLASDPLGTLPQGERTLIAGNGSQTGPDGRWGDYSMMAVDPADDCTFWYTQEYLSATADRAWRTRIGSFKFPGCVAVPTATPTGPRPTRTPTPPPTPRPSATATPCPGGVTYSGSITMSDPVEAGRLVRDGIASTCSTPKSCPGVNDAIPRHYDSYTYTNSSTSPQCVTVTINENCGNDALLSTAYLGAFDPNNICANYLADMGVAGPTFSYSFTIPASSSATIVVEENSANIGCGGYTLTVNPCAVSGAN